MPTSKTSLLKTLKLSKVSEPEPVASIVGFQKDINTILDLSSEHNVSEAIILRSLIASTEDKVLFQAIKHYSDARS
jgi:hypothetical protein